MKVCPKCVPSIEDRLKELEESIETRLSLMQESIETVQRDARSRFDALLKELESIEGQLDRKMNKFW